MRKYQIWAPDYNWKGGYGNSSKEKIHDPFASRFDQEFMPIEDLYAKTANDRSGQLVTTMGLQSRIKRDMAIDAMNPREKLPEDIVSAKMIDTIPMYGYSHPPDTSDPEDFKQNDQVRLIQQAFFNAQNQANLFTNPTFAQDEKITSQLNTDHVGKGNMPLKQSEYYSMDGSAAGLETNLLGGELPDEDYRVNSTENMVAF